MRHVKILLIAYFVCKAALLDLSQMAANLSTAFPPPPSANLIVPIHVVQCLPARVTGNDKYSPGGRR